MRIDVHAHVVPDAYLALVRQGAVPDVRLVRDGAREVLEVHGGGASGPVVQRLPLDASWHDPAARLAAMDAAGVDVHVLSPVQFMYHYWLDGSFAAAAVTSAGSFAPPSARAGTSSGPCSSNR